MAQPLTLIPKPYLAGRHRDAAIGVAQSVRVDLPQTPHPWTLNPTWLGGTGTQSTSKQLRKTPLLYGLGRSS